MCVSRCGIQQVKNATEPLLRPTTEEPVGLSLCLTLPAKSPSMPWTPGESVYIIRHRHTHTHTQTCTGHQMIARLVPFFTSTWFDIFQSINVVLAPL